jgi:hypothetical protein
MVRKILVVVAGMMVLMVQLACADELGDCQANCGKKLQECIASINSPNDIEVQDMKAACKKVRSDCDHFCDGRGEDPYKEEKEKAAREQQEKDQNSGQIKTYKFGE